MIGSHGIVPSKAWQASAGDPGGLRTQWQFICLCSYVVGSFADGFYNVLPESKVGLQIQVGRRCWKMLCICL